MLEPRRRLRSLNEPVITQAQIRQIRIVGLAAAKAGDRPSTAEFAAAPLYGHTMVDRLLKDLEVMPRRTHESRTT